MSCPSFAFERLALKNGRIAFDVVEESGLHDEEPGVDPAFAVHGFFTEGLHFVVRTGFDHAEARGRTGEGHGDKFSVAFVKRDEFLDVHIADAIAIGAHEGFVFEQGGEAAQAAAGHGVQPSVDERDFPVENRALDGGLFPGGHVDGEIRVECVIIKEEGFHVFRLVSKSQREVRESIVGVNVHDMPDHGLPADGDHGFRNVIGVFGEAGAIAAGEDYGFHCAVLVSRLGAG